MKQNNILKLVFIATIVFCITQIIVTSFAIKPVIYPVTPLRINATDFDSQDTLDVVFWLEEDKMYHIFIVGNWVGSTESRTDYDVTYFDTLSDLDRSHTEAPAFPEQIWNDGKGMYYLSKYTGKHTFKIWYDGDDSVDDDNEERDATMMAIEHIEVDRVYFKVLKGRSISGGEYEYNTFFNPWAWEFNTKANEFEVYVEVPDSLDMFELRLYPMAQPSTGIGYNLSGVGTPTEALLDPSILTGVFGGYDTSTAQGQRNIIASCEYPGEDMRILFKSSENEGITTFYYIVLIAEYFEGEVKFWIKTDFTEPILTNENNVTVGISDSPTEIWGNVESNNEIKEGYIEYSTDDWASKTRTPLVLNRDNDYAGTIPAYDLHTIVDYRVKIQDTLNNIGSLQGEYTVLDPASTSLRLSRQSIVGGKNIQITGECSVPNANINLSITHAEFTDTFNIVTDADGEFILDYGPPQDGSYTVSFTFDGDENHMSVISPSKSFTVTKLELDLNLEVDASEYKLNQPVIIQGRVSPPTAGVILDLNIVTPTTYRVESVVTTDVGTFYTTIISSELGTWEILPQLSNTALISVASNEVVRFNVVQLTTTEKLVLFLQSMTKFPGIMIPVGLIITILVGLELKTRFFRSLIKKQNDKKAQDEPLEEEKKSNGPSSYRLRKKEKKDNENGPKEV